MSTGRIVSIVLGVALLLGLLAFGACYYLLQTQGPKLKAAAQASMAEASEFGRSTDNQGCLVESLERYDRCGEGFACNVMNNGFVLSCLKASSPVADFCDGVPASDSFTGSVAWRLDQCEKHGRGGTLCGNFFGQVQKYCNSRLLE